MLLHKEITSAIINAFYTVYNTLGYGFLEKVYENALLIELEKQGLKVQTQVPIQVYYKEKMLAIILPICSSQILLSLNSKPQKNLSLLMKHNWSITLKPPNLKSVYFSTFEKKPNLREKFSPNKRKITSHQTVS